MIYLLLPATLACSYLIGAFSSAYFAGRLFGRIDLREHGSGNLGATNAFRVLGPWVATVIFGLDFAKGLVAVLLAGWVARSLGAIDPTVALVVAGFGVIAGHTWPFYLGFKGGKGVATGAGAVLALVGWKVVLALLLLFIAVVGVTRYVSVGSVAISAAFPVLVAWLHRGNTAYILFAVLASGLVIFNHRTNLGRLAAGRELKLGERPDGPKGPNA